MRQFVAGRNVSVRIRFYNQTHHKQAEAFVENGTVEEEQVVDLGSLLRVLRVELVVWSVLVHQVGHGGSAKEGRIREHARNEQIVEIRGK